ncbi:39S ribosomal protein L3, mitochondrial [Schistocerca nitens]|uniref:39S ribosomal protein L3, mitochondrial n=1 Tax=Schistocerca nitens TaxID=7011 RepID=UPI0021176C13|nr:39S ribosomal protein L3, mitochondrial [Schistocerca nitens]
MAAGTVWKVFASIQTNICFLKPSFDSIITQSRGKRLKCRPRLRYPTWFVKKERSNYNENLTQENSAFIKEVVQDKYGLPAVIGGVLTCQQSPLKNAPLERGEWTPKTRRTGVIARKIGCYPMWLKDGSKIHTTLLQVVDNHVIRYIPPEEFDPPRKRAVRQKYPNRYGCLLVGAESADPQMFTKEYCGLFKDSGVMPKKTLGRFMVSPEAVIQPGTPLYASHFRVGDVVDVRGKTIDRGFQGVVKRWGFKGGPASHGVTKTHRRPGNIGGGGEKGRVWPGTKMPGHMGNRYRILRGLKIWRINTKYNVLYVQGLGVAGETNSIVYIYDTVLPRRKLKEAPPFPTFYPEDLDKELPEDIYAEEVHSFKEPSVTFS